MPVLFLIFITAAIAAVIFFLPRTRGNPSPPPEPAPEGPDQGQVTEAAERLGAVLDLLLAVMTHPQLGGPGFLTVQFPPPGEGGPGAEAQFPNIQEALYRRILQGQADREALVQAGVPEALFFYHPVFEAESGGMVLLSVRLPGLDPALETLLDSRRGRAQILGALAERLGRRYPELTVRSLGNGLLLSPERL